MTRGSSARRRLATVLQLLVALFALIALVLMLWEPQVEGRNAHATQFEIYFKDPFLAYAYLGSIAFFAALFQIFKLLGYIGEDRTVSPDSVRALRTIRRCAFAIVILVGAAVAYLFIAVRATDDIAGGVAIGFFMILASAVIGIAAAVFERRLQTAVDAKS